MSSRSFLLALHTRISEGLEDDLRKAAEELRVPVSNLVRNVLEEAVTVVEAVSDEFGELIEDVVDSAEEIPVDVSKAKVDETLALAAEALQGVAR